MLTQSIAHGPYLEILPEVMHTISLWWCSNDITPATNFVQFCLPMLKQIWTKSTQLAYCLKRHLSLSAWMSPSKGLPIGTSNRFDQQLYECTHLWYDHCQWIHCWHYPTFFSCISKWHRVHFLLSDVDANDFDLTILET